MFDLSIQDWGAIGEVIGAVAVILTLVHLAITLRRSTRATHRQTYHAAAEAIARFSMELAEKPDLHKLYRTTLRYPQSLSDDELQQGFLVLESYMALMESFYLHNQEFAEIQSQRRWSDVLTRLLSTPGGDKYWRDRRWLYHAGFAAYVDSLVGR